MKDIQRHTSPTSEAQPKVPHSEVLALPSGSRTRLEHHTADVFVIIFYIWLDSLTPGRVFFYRFKSMVFGIMVSYSITYSYSSTVVQEYSYTVAVGGTTRAAKQ